MDCWIGISGESGRRLVRLAGRLSAAQVPELLEACAVGGAIEIDLTDLIGADAAGVEALQRVQTAGAVLVSVPGYIRLKLDSLGNKPDAPMRAR